CARSSNGFDYW
nr:immunoglobulin heavy chain junction region [Macaca mulatta]MOW86648.1 immunoglobulin heavy chain junction region [Macaca mulatta]MOW87867.1 immunoglobulin heavy chain junction region [Macaca mulatta]MOW88199.1 immunoglobulin heavy chain junction region [Macaca mulatta]MOW90793.1 immunoglobulin heavy chain junction region [Macaca mulatta]